jgi:hypothetical protein
LRKITERYRDSLLFYSAIGQTQYFQIAGKLASQGVKYSTKIQNDFRGRDNYSDRSRVYDIYIRIEDEGRAGEALRKRG